MGLRHPWLLLMDNGRHSVELPAQPETEHADCRVIADKSMANPFLVAYRTVKDSMLCTGGKPYSSV